MQFADFTALFHRATGNPKPFPYQAAFATADKLPELVHAPTGAGKTATAILGWVWHCFTLRSPPLAVWPTASRCVYWSNKPRTKPESG